MDDNTKQQIGSPSRDIFKRKHKDISKELWACDLDFVLVEKYPFPDIVAALDYKRENDDISFSENIAYCALLRRGTPVYILIGDAEAGIFTIYKFMGGNHVKPRNELKELYKTKSWHDFENWEKEIRDRWRKRYSK